MSLEDMYNTFETITISFSDVTYHKRQINADLISAEMLQDPKLKVKPSWAVIKV